ncbi:hypothetical protein GLOIN_2v1764798 [Rhizophagus clarus]|uniref:F-box domain-containing protein n=1 Tax=Rhizophagus clarus TaxID=94130 RepID=A0A8H3QKG9_9GLOM|nr:hypothetical protein GLOIN_2v1764798 [Rhizophagus clarus]
MSPTPLGFITKGTPNLPSDCIEEILKSLYRENDQASLYSWTLVNRSWCQVAISLLWSHPFKNMKFNGSDNEKGYLIIRTYISCLSDEATQQLIDEGHKIKNTKTLFDYPTYLKELHIGNLQLSIGQWWEKTTDYMLKHKAQFQTVESLISEMLFNKCNGLKKLDCELQQFRYNNNSDFVSFSGTQKAVSRLNEFHIDCTCVDHQGHLYNLLTTIINISQNINHIIVTPYHECPLAQQIPKLIESQNNLISFNFRRIFIDWNSLEILTKCSNLKNLKFINCYQEQDITLPDSLYKSIQLTVNKLTLNNEKNNETFLSEITYTTIVMMSKNRLKELAIDFFNPELSQIINTQIPNLSSLSIRTIPPIQQLEWISCSNSLSHLSLSDVGITSRLFSITICQQIGQILPANLLHLQLESRYNIAPESLTGILENTDAKLEVISLDVEKFDDTLLEVVGDYARDTGKRLKELRIGKDTRIEFDPSLCKKLLYVIPSINQNYEDPWPVLIERRDPLWKNILEVNIE